MGIKPRLLIIVAVLTLIFGVTGCATMDSTPLDNLDDMQLASFRVAVGAVMTAAPEVVEPAYQISDAMMALISKDPAIIEAFEATVRDKITELGLKQDEAQSVVEIFHLLRASIEKLDDHQARLNAVNTLLEIVKQCAEARREAREVTS